MTPDWHDCRSRTSAFRLPGTVEDGGSLRKIIAVHRVSSGKDATRMIGQLFLIEALRSNADVCRFGDRRGGRLPPSRAEKRKRSTVDREHRSSLFRRTGPGLLLVADRTMGRSSYPVRTEMGGGSCRDARSGFPSGKSGPERDVWGGEESRGVIDVQLCSAATEPTPKGRRYTRSHSKGLVHAGDPIGAKR
jgi:hypothetical protein